MNKPSFENCSTQLHKSFSYQKCKKYLFLLKRFHKVSCDLKLCFADKEKLCQYDSYLLYGWQPISSQCSTYIETLPLICNENQLTGFYMSAILPSNGLQSHITIDKPSMLNQTGGDSCEDYNDFLSTCIKIVAKFQFLHWTNLSELINFYFP